MRVVWLRSVVAVLAVLALTAFAAPALAAGRGGDRLPLRVADPFAVIAQQVTIVRAAPSTRWVLGGQFGASRDLPIGPGSWSVGVQTSPADSHGRVRAVAVFTQRGGDLPLVNPFPTAPPSPPDEGCSRKTDTWSCRVPIPFAPGDTYELLYGGSVSPYGPVVHDMTFNFDAFDPLTVGDQQYPLLSGLYDSTTYLDSGACARQGVTLAGVSTPLAGEPGLLGPVPPIYPGLGLPESQGAVAARGEQLSGCARSSSFRVAPAAPWWSEAERYRALPHVQFDLSARWTPTRTWITKLRPLGARAPMVFELDCFGPRCPLATVRGRYGHLAKFEHALKRHPFHVGDWLDLRIGTTTGCGPQCEWGSELLSLRIRPSKIPQVLGCDFKLGVNNVFGRRCAGAPGHN